MTSTAPPPPSQPQAPSLQKLIYLNEQTWLHIGKLAESMSELDRAHMCFENSLRHNPYSVPALTAIANLCRSRDQYSRAVEYFQRVLNIEVNNGTIWSSVGHCYLMMDELQKAHTSYQQALYHLSDPKEPKLWYGIGILYDRYNSYDHAEEAFKAVITMDPSFEKANEIYFRLGIIYKAQQKYKSSLECFQYILNNPPNPLSEADIWFQIGNVYENKKEYSSAREAFERGLNDNKNHSRILQQLGWLYFQPDTGFTNQEQAITLLTRTVEIDPNDAHSWYLLGRCHIAQNKHRLAYDAYQQAVYRDSQNPIFWCSIGVLYFNMSQFRDALDAYSRSIRINPYISEVWYNLGVLYETCNSNQVQDAIDAYQKALDLDPNKTIIKQRLAYLKQSPNVPTSGFSQSAPTPQDINPISLQGPSNYYQNNPRNPLDVHPPSNEPKPPLERLTLDGRPPLDNRPPIDPRQSIENRPKSASRLASPAPPPHSESRLPPYPMSSMASERTSRDYPEFLNKSHPPTVHPESVPPYPTAATNGHSHYYVTPPPAAAHSVNPYPRQSIDTRAPPSERVSGDSRLPMYDPRMSDMRAPNDPRDIRDHRAVPDNFPRPPSRPPSTPDMRPPYPPASTSEYIAQREAEHHMPHSRHDLNAASYPTHVKYPGHYYPVYRH